MNDKHSDKHSGPGLTYRDAGVDIDAGDLLVETIKPYAHATSRPGVLDGLGGFGALFEVPVDRYQHPVLVSGTDGVGTKLKLAIDLASYDTIGIDLVAMCVNDIIVQGAEPLFFLDYYATGRLQVTVASAVIKGISEGCRMAGAALIGGETAEMPGMYRDDDFDLAGFCVGVVEKAQIITGKQVRAGDALIGIASSGPHSNGYSLIRKIVADRNLDLAAQLDGRQIKDLLMAPTRIYVKPVLDLIGKIPVHAIAHITGGGISENLPRVLPDSLRAVIAKSAWPCPPIFEWLQRQGNIEEREMFRTFNRGIGLIICVPQESLSQAMALLEEHGETVWHIGSIEPRTSGAYVVID